MKNYIYLILILLISSCSDFFDLEPTSEISANNYFNSERALRIYTNGFLSRGLPSPAALTRGDQYSDISVTSVTEGFLRENYTPRDANNWGVGNWSALHNINYFLSNMYDAAEYVNDDLIMKHYEGVGRFWRAWFYWDKVKTFGDVPWYDAPIDPDDEESLYKPRDNRDFVMNKVLEDLNFSVDNCLTSGEFRDKNVINKYVALALKSRICLYEGTYRKYHNLGDHEGWLRESLLASEELMNNSDYDLFGETGSEETNYSRLFKSKSPIYKEIILSNEMSTDEGRLHDATWWYASPSYGNRNSATKAFVNMYLTLDGTPFTNKTDYNAIEFKEEFHNRDYRLKQTIITPEYVKRVSGGETNDFSKILPDLGSQLTYYRIMKWNIDDDSYESTTRSDNSLSVFRFGEILLNYAEAKAELGEMGIQEWNRSIRRLRERSGVNGIAPTNADPYLVNYYDGLSDMWILEVRRERTIEMFMENVRRDDLMRWKMGHKLVVEFDGLYIPEIGKPFDLNGDGKNDLCFYSTSIPRPPQTENGVTYVQITVNENDASTTFKVNEDNCLVYNLYREWKDYKYLYPIPQTALNINPNLGQNEGWDKFE